MKPELYEQYAKILADEKVLKAEKELLKGQILQEIEDKPKEFEWGKFSRSIRKTYTYSEELQDRALDLKEAQLDEVEQGKAQIKESPYITFTGYNK